MGTSNAGLDPCPVGPEVLIRKANASFAATQQVSFNPTPHSQDGPSSPQPNSHTTAEGLEARRDPRHTGSSSPSTSRHGRPQQDSLRAPPVATLCRKSSAPLHPEEGQGENSGRVGSRPQMANVPFLPKFFFPETRAIKADQWARKV